MNKKTFLIFFGAPGSGKGTQVSKVSKRLSLPIISTGDLLRQEKEAGTELGKKIKPIIDSGKLVSDKIIEKLILKKLDSKDVVNGAIFDGFPRNISQQKFLVYALSKLKNSKVSAVLIDVADKEIKSRLTGRRICVCGASYHIKATPPKKSGICDKCGKKLKIRTDDKPSVISDRLKIYHKEMDQMLKFWKNNNLAIIPGEGKIDDVYKNVVKELRKIL